MNFEQLIERMNATESIRETGCINVFKEWYTAVCTGSVNDIHANYCFQNLCGVFYGFYAFGFINEQEHAEVYDELSKIHFR